MVLKEPFTTASPVVASVSFTELITQSGVLSLNGYSLESSTGITYGLAANNVHSDVVETKAPLVLTGTSFAKIMDLDFDTNAAGVAITMDGTATCNLSAGYKIAASQIVDLYIIAKLRTWDGTTETEVASAQTKTFQENGVSIFQSTNFTVPITVPNTVVPVGTSIRLTLELWAKGNGGGVNIDYYIAHSPFNESGDLDPSDTDQAIRYNQTIINIPIRTDQ